MIFGNSKGEVNICFCRLIKASNDMHKVSESGWEWGLFSFGRLGVGLKRRSISLLGLLRQWGVFITMIWAEWEHFMCRLGLQLFVLSKSKRAGGNAFYASLMLAWLVFGNAEGGRGKHCFCSFIQACNGQNGKH